MKSSSHSPSQEIAILYIFTTTPIFQNIFWDTHLNYYFF
jgi:hypothetical protein